jgi:hypothetical protein
MDLATAAANGTGDAERGDSAPASPSRRVALEVEILAAGAAPPPDAEAGVASETERAGTRLVLVAATDPELFAYVRDCLRARADLRVVEATRNSVADAVARHHPHLVISDGAGGDPTVPRILLTDEAPADAPSRSLLGEAPVVVLTTPFNKRRLLEAVTWLLGPPP